jgi:hypothetical protein
MALAGASVLWAFKPDYTFQRFGLQALILSSIVLPILLTGRNTDVLCGLFLCFAFACIMNVPFVLFQEPIYLQGASIGYPGYFLVQGPSRRVCRAHFSASAWRNVLYQTSASVGARHHRRHDRCPGCPITALSAAPQCLLDA